MTDETSTGAEPQAGDATGAPQPPAGKTTSAEPQAGDAPSETISLDEAKKLRQEAASLRKREKDVLAQLKEYQDKEQAAKEAELSDLERVKKQHSDLEAQHHAAIAELQALKIAQAVERQAFAMGFRDPEDAIHNLKTAELDYDEAGKPTNVEKLLDKVAKGKPYLLKEQASPAQETPAQTAPAAKAPTIPAMNPGRTAIQSPATNATPGRIPGWNDVYKRP